MIWKNLTIPQRDEVLARFNSGERSEDLAREFGLLSSSLERKLRLLRPQAERIFKKKVLRYSVDAPLRTMIYSDCHFGQEDDDALAAAIEVARAYQPELIINLGDTLDCHHLSKFKHDANAPSSQDERDKWFLWAEELNSVTSGAVRFIIGGNHEERLESALSSTSGLNGIEELTLEEYLYIGELGYDGVYDVIQVNPRGDEFFPDAELYLLHGEKALSQAGSSAKAASDMYVGASTIVGHAHRSAVYTRRTDRGIIKAYEVGTLGTLMPDYAIYPNWSQSVLTGVIAPGFHDFSINMIDRGRVVVGGQLRGRM